MSKKNESNEPVVLAIIQEGEEGALHSISTLSFSPDGTLKTLATRVMDLPSGEEEFCSWLVTANNRWLAICRPQADPDSGQLLERLALDTLADGDSCTLGQVQPGSLSLSGDSCLLGGVGRLEQVDFGASPAEVRPVFTAQPEAQQNKAVDHMTISDGILVAVDDRVQPKFAFVLKRDQVGNWSHLYTSPLPEYPNEIFLQAASCGGKLAIRTSFHHRAGAGQRLLLLDVAEDGLTVTAQAMEIRGTGMLKYGRSRLAGRTHSNWNSLALLGDHVFIGAAERGILICHRDMGDLDRASKMKPGGACLDLIVRGQRIYALVSSGKGKKAQTTLVVLAFDPDQASLVVKATHPLSDHPTRFVH